MSELGVNKVILIGRSGGDAALKFHPGQQAGGEFLVGRERVVHEPGRRKEGPRGVV